VRYFLAIICPPLAVFLCGKPLQAILAFFLWLALWIPGSIYALFVVSGHKADLRNKELIKAMEKAANKAATETSKATIKAAKITAEFAHMPPVLLKENIVVQQITLRIAKNGADIGDMELSNVKNLIQVGELQTTDYFFDYESNEWRQLTMRSDL